MPSRASPNKGTSWVESGVLHRAEHADATIPVGSLEWFTWLAQASRFYVKNNEHGNYFCRKEVRQRGGVYWYAYRRAGGRAYTTYAGSDQDLTTQALDTIATKLALSIAQQGVTTMISRASGKKRIDPPKIQTVTTDTSTLWFHLTDGRMLGAPLDWFPRLIAASPEQRQAWELIDSSTGAHWPDVDEHISVRVLMNLPS